MRHWLYRFFRPVLILLLSVAIPITSIACSSFRVVSKDGSVFLFLTLNSADHRAPESSTTQLVQILSQARRMAGNPLFGLPNVQFREWDGLIKPCLLVASTSTGLRLPI